MNSLNFSGGPGILPESVLRETQQSIEAVPEVGLSILGISHRSQWFADVVAEAEANIRALLDVPDDYCILFLQGGATLQFSMIPMLLLRHTGKTAEYLRTGYWSSKAIPEAVLEGDVKVVWDGESCGFRRLPTAEELEFSPSAAYLHYVSNETVEGTQFHQVLGLDDVPRVCDMSSDFLSRPVDVRRFSIIYAHAQKNLGPAGVTVVIVKRDLLDSTPKGIPALLDYREHLKAHSIYNTPPVFAIYVAMLITRWILKDVGGLEKMNEINQQKARLLYKTVDESNGLITTRAALENRSLMNVVFGFQNTEIEKLFLQKSALVGFSGLNGHRSIGGIRASIYNAMTIPAVEKLSAFLRDFVAAHCIA